MEEGYRTIPFPFAEIAPPDFAMSAHWTLDEVLGYCSTWSATNRYMKENGTNPIEPLRERLGSVWGPPERKRHVTWPLSLRVGRVD